MALAKHAMEAEVPDEPDTRRVKQMIGGMMNGGGGGGMGTLQALLTELSGLKKPRGFVNRYVRRVFGMRPKPPPKYRILVMMATNMPSALDEALLRPGRIDRIYKVGYPSKAGRIRTYEGYFAKVRHELTAEQLDKLATITPYATGATIKDLVNESLITAIRNGRDVITWPDVIKAKQLKELGPPEDVEYIERERHAVAVHEACHALVAFRTRQHMEIDIATIEKGSDYLGMVASIPPEDQFTRWRSEYETDILVSLASLAGERMFFEQDSSSGVSGDLESATAVASYMEGFWGMGTTVSSYSTAKRLEVGSPGGGRGGALKKGQDPEAQARHALADRIEDQLTRLLGRTEEIIRENRNDVLALAHALETYKTLSGEDVVAVLDHTRGPLVDGTPYGDADFMASLSEYHQAAARAHRNHSMEQLNLPVPAPAALPWATGVIVAEPDPLGLNGHNPDHTLTPALTRAAAVRPGLRARQVVNLVNGSTLAGLGVAALGGAELSPQRRRPVHRHRIPAAGAARARVLPRKRDHHPAARPSRLPARALFRHEARHATQYAWCGGLVMIPLYLAAAGVSWVLTGDFGARNVFERQAGLADGGYADRPLRAAIRQLSVSQLGVRRLRAAQAGQQAVSGRRRRPWPASAARAGSTASSFRSAGTPPPRAARRSRS